MNELSIELTEINPRDFFGNQNANIDLLKKYFPKLKLVARGSNLKAFGDDQVLQEFDKRIAMLLEHFAKFNRIDENIIERVLSSTSKADYETSSKSGDVLVHGVNGKLVKARTANQRKIVDFSKTKDLVFAVGPAGTGKTYTAVALAVKALKEKQVKRIIMTRPCCRGRREPWFFAWRFKRKARPLHATLV